MFVNGPKHLGLIPGRNIPKTLKMVLDTSLLNTQQCKVCIKGKVEKSRERSCAPLHLGVVAIEKRTFWSPTTIVANFPYCYGDISYHTPKMDSSNLNTFAELRTLGEDNFTFLTRNLTDCKPRTASTSIIWLPFSANTITFTYHPLFELFFHRSYLKTTTLT